MGNSRRRTNVAVSGFAALVAGLLTSAGARAETMTVFAVDHPDVPSFFTLNFGEAGVVASGHIAATDLEVEIDADNGTARFVRYYQEVEPLTLPGGFSTGSLTIEVVEDSSNGTFNDLTGEFMTAETYAIHFDGDLSAFGLESPVMLESTSAGSVTLDIDTGGMLSMEWTGDGVLANPFDPTQPLTFSYRCSVNAVFTLEPVTSVRLALVPDVVNLALPKGLENNLLRKLSGTLASLDRGNIRAATRSLGAFVHAVDALAGHQLSMVDADLLANTATAVIVMLDDGLARSSGSRNGSHKATPGGLR